MPWIPRTAYGIMPGSTAYAVRRRRVMGLETRSAAVLAEGLAKRYGKTRALDGFDLQVPAGAVCGLLGPNGAGKTTAVRILATLIRPDGGRAAVAGFDVIRQAAEVRARIGLVGQNAAVDEILSG